jgi:hypothetical protein
MVRTNTMCPKGLHFSKRAGCRQAHITFDNIQTDGPGRAARRSDSYSSPPPSEYLPPPVYANTSQLRNTLTTTRVRCLQFANIFGLLIKRSTWASCAFCSVSRCCSISCISSSKSWWQVILSNLSSQSAENFKDCKSKLAEV